VHIDDAQANIGRFVVRVRIVFDAKTNSLTATAD